MVWNDRAFKAIVDSHKNPDSLPEGCCENTERHSPHEYIHYDIDLNVYNRMWCQGNFLTVD